MNIESIVENSLERLGLSQLNDISDDTKKSLADRLDHKAKQREEGIVRAIDISEASDTLISRGLVGPTEAAKLAMHSEAIGSDKATGEAHYLHPKHGHISLIPVGEKYQLRSVNALKEDVLNELSPSTLGNYIKHAAIDKGAAQGVAAAERAIARMSGTADNPDEHYMDQSKKETARANKRFRGILRATDKLVAKTHSAKEVEESLEGDTLNELSKGTLGRYITKAAKDISLRSYLAGNHELGREKIEVTLKHIDKSNKHTKGIEKVVKKLTEAAPPDMEDWVKENKAKFVKQYGDKKGHEILYATAWKMHNKKMNEDVLNEVSIGQVVKLRNGKHFQVSGFKMDKGTKLTNVPRVGIAPEPGSKVTHYIGTLGNSRYDAEHDYSRTEVPVEDVIKVIRGN